MTNRDGRVETFFAEKYLPLLQSAKLADYDAIMASQSGTKMVKPNLGTRERIQLALTASDGSVRTVYLKRYGDNDSARREWHGLQQVRSAGVPTAEPVAFGAGPAGGFVMVSAVPGEALSRRADELLRTDSPDGEAPRALAQALGELIGTFHAGGLTHRDFYTAHVFVDGTPPALNLYLIDLARVFHPRWRRWRWRAKDLSQLRASLPHAWAEAHWPTLWSAYRTALGECIPLHAALLVWYRTGRLRREIARREAAAEGAK